MFVCQMQTLTNNLFLSCLLMPTNWGFIEKYKRLLKRNNELSLQGDWKITLNLQNLKLLFIQVAKQVLSCSYFEYADCKYAKRFWKYFEIKDLGGCHILYVEKDTFLLADVFESFQNKYIGIYKLDAAHLLSVRGLT